MQGFQTSRKHKKYIYLCKLVRISTTTCLYVSFVVQVPLKALLQHKQLPLTAAHKRQLDQPVEWTNLLRLIITPIIPIINPINQIHVNYT